MARILELSDQDFNRTVSDMLRALMKVDNIQERMGIVSRKTEILRMKMKW